MAQHLYRVGRYRDGWAAVTGHGRTRRRLTLDARSKADAEGQVAELNGRAERKKLGNDRTVKALFEYYVADREADGVPAVKRMRQAWKPLEPHFGHLSVDQITKTVCRDYIKMRTRRGVSDGGIRTELTYLSVALRLAKTHKLITDSAEIVRPPQPRPRDRWLTHEEVPKLVAGAVLPHAKLFILLAVATAGRPSHILQLTWPRVRLEKKADPVTGEVLSYGSINLDDPGRDKTAKGRAHVPITEEAYEALELARKVALTDYVIEYNEKPVLSVKKAIAAAARRAKLQGVTPYVLRHTAAVWMAQAGIPMAEIAQYLGHTNPAVTFRVYARYSPDYLRRAADALRLQRPPKRPPKAIEDKRDQP